MDFNDLILRIQQASIEPALWRDVTIEISDHFGKRPIMLGVQWLPKGVSYMKTARLPPEPVARISERYSSVESNPFLAAALPKMRLHKPILVKDVIPPEQFEATEYYKDTIARMGGVVGDAVIACSLSRSRLSALVLARHEDQEPASDREIDMMREISPHLGHAFEVMIRLGHLTSSYDALDQVLCRLPQAVALCDASGRIVFTNPSFDSVLESSLVLRVRDGFIDFDQRGDRNGLSKFLKTGLDTTNGDEGQNFFELCDDASGQSVTLFFQRVQTEFADEMDLSGVAAIMFLNSVGVQRTDMLAGLAEKFRLSTQQAEVLRQVTHGRSGPEISKKLSISQNTLKTHLARIHEKTGTTTREDLLRLLIGVAVNAPVSLRNGDG